MSELFQCRLDGELLKATRAVAAEIGLSPGDLVRLTFKQFVRRRAVPFPVQADAPEDDALMPAAYRARLWEEMEQ